MNAREIDLTRPEEELLDELNALNGNFSSSLNGMTHKALGGGGDDDSCTHVIKLETACSGAGLAGGRCLVVSTNSSNSTRSKPPRDAQFAPSRTARLVRDRLPRPTARFRAG